MNKFLNDSTFFVLGLTFDPVGLCSNYGFDAFGSL